MKKEGVIMAKFCYNCGKELNENQDICLNCGVRVNNTTGYVNTDPTAKSRMVAGILGIVFGAFGVHNFYLGYTGKAVAQLLISVLTCFLLSPIAYIWGLIEGILILAGNINEDAEGHALKE